MHTLTSGVAGLFKKNGIDLIEGDATLTADGDVRVGEQSIGAGSVILATGSVPRAIPGVELGGRVIGTEEAWALQELPARLAVVGAGASGAEIASGFARLGSEVILLEALDRVLPSEDADISRLVERGLKRQGITVHTGTPIADVQPGERSVSFAIGEERAEVDYLVICAGRGADVEGLGLAEAGVELDARAGPGRRRDAHLARRRLRDRRPRARPGARAQGLRRGHHRRRGLQRAADAPDRLRRHPAGDVLHAQRRLLRADRGAGREQGYDVVVGKVPYGAVGGGTVYGDRTGLVKVVGESKYGELLGGHIVGSRATELIQELVNVRALEGGFPEVGRIIHGHPTLSEAVMEAGRAADGWLIHG